MVVFPCMGSVSLTIGSPCIPPLENRDTAEPTASIMQIVTIQRVLYHTVLNIGCALVSLPKIPYKNVDDEKIRFGL